MKWTFPTLYKQWLEINPKVKEDLMKMAEQHQRDHEGQKIYIGLDAALIQPAPQENSSPTFPQNEQVAEKNWCNPYQISHNFEEVKEIKEEYVSPLEPYQPRNVANRTTNPEFRSQGYRHQNQRPHYEKRNLHNNKRKREVKYSLSKEFEGYLKDQNNHYFTFTE